MCRLQRLRLRIPAYEASCSQLTFFEDRGPNQDTNSCPPPPRSELQTQGRVQKTTRRNVYQLLSEMRHMAPQPAHGAPYDGDSRPGLHLGNRGNLRPQGTFPSVRMKRTSAEADQSEDYPSLQICIVGKILDGSGSGGVNQLRIRFGVKGPTGSDSGSGENGPALAAPAPFPG